MLASMQKIRNARYNTRVRNLPKNIPSTTPKTPFPNSSKSNKCEYVKSLTKWHGDLKKLGLH